MASFNKGHLMIALIAYPMTILAKLSGPLFTTAAVCIIVSGFFISDSRFFVIAQWSLLVSGLCNLLLTRLVDHSLCLDRQADSLMTHLNNMLTYMRSNGRLIKAEAMRIDNMDRIAELAAESKEWADAEKSLTHVIDFMNRPASDREHRQINKENFNESV